MKPVALITGGGMRIGRALSAHMASCGYDLMIHYNASKEEASQVKKELSSFFNVDVTLYQGDLNDPMTPQKLIKETFLMYQRVDVLICNASVFLYDTLETATLDLWDLHLNVNTRSSFLLAQEFAKVASDRSNIIFMIDQSILKPQTTFMCYTVSKASLLTLTKSIALSLAPRIRVNAIAPGPTLRNDRQSEAHFQNECAKTPLQKGVPLEDIQRALEFILKTESLTGHMIPVDCGQHLI